MLEDWELSLEKKNKTNNDELLDTGWLFSQVSTQAVRNGQKL